MFIELPHAEFKLVRAMFSRRRQYVPAIAVIQGAFPGRVFVDNANSPSMAIVWALGRWAYIEGGAHRTELKSSLTALLSETIIPDSRHMQFNWFELYAPNSPAWIELLDQTLQPYGATRHSESVYTWNQSSYRQLRARHMCPSGLTLELMEMPIVPEKILGSRFVPELFRTRAALACSAIVNGETVAVCRSNGFADADEFMIDVVTYEKDLRGKGYATAAAVGLLDACIERNMVPLWETTEDNTASRRLAAKLGFVERESYPVYRIDFR